MFPLECHNTFCLFLSLLFIAHFAIAEYSQSVAVKGVLTCNGLPSSGTTVKLFDQDTLDFDDLMKEEVTDRQGQFLISGHEEELFEDIVPKLAIIHDCNLPCPVQMVISIPRRFVTNGSTPKKIFNVGKIRLEANFKKQKLECFNE